MGSIAAAMSSLVSQRWGGGFSPDTVDVSRNAVRASEVRAESAKPVGSNKQRPRHRRGEEITRRLVKGLDRQRNGFVNIFTPHAGIGDAGGHLNQAVKTTASRLRPCPAIGTQRDVNQSGVELTSFLRPKTQSI